MKTTVRVENARCDRCSNAVHKDIGTLNGIFGVSIDIANGTVTVDHTDEVSREAIVKHLADIGFTVVD